ncbi:MAG: toll/interleukin-1 receptor domain-containing protein [Anaerolineae bacterium]|nr:toll/interleukin-1 receptor domain-containing protein [Anaerolineae bacterium]
MRKAKPVDLFLSYAHEDKDSVKSRIIDSLPNKKYKLWYDIRIQPPQDFWEEIENHIKECCVFLFAVSPASIQSEACQRELALAHKCGIRILPILIEKTEPEKLPEQIHTLQWLDLTGVMTGDKRRRLLNLVKSLTRDCRESDWICWLVILGALMIGGILGFVIADLLCESCPTCIPTPVATSAPTVIPSPTITPRPTIPVDQTLESLIEREAQAILMEDEQAIADIYLAEAIIEDADPNGHIWYGALAYYAEKWAREVHCHIEHADFEILVLTDNYAQVTTSSAGDFGYRSDNNGCPNRYDNPSGADVWEFTRDETGQWRIVHFTFNAHTK